MEFHPLVRTIPRRDGLANRRMILTLVLVVVILVILAGATAYYLTLPPGKGGTPGLTSTCTGSKTYSGLVENTTGAAVQGAVVSLAATPPNFGTYANATTDASGAWSASVSSVCAYTARVFWQSAVNSPLLAQRSNLAATSTFDVNVSWANVTLTVLEEFPHASNANVTATIPAGFTFFVEANSTGSIPLGFLQTDATGSPGYGFYDNSSDLKVDGGLPYGIIRPAARAYRVVDLNGNSVVYAVPLLQAFFGSAGITDPLNMTAAIAQVQARGGIPYVQVAAHGTFSLPLNVTNQTHVFAGLTTGVFGVSLEAFVTLYTNSTAQLGLRATFTNTTNRTQCFVLDQEGVQIHTWAYGAGACP